MSQNLSTQAVMAVAMLAAENEQLRAALANANQQTTISNEQLNTLAAVTTDMRDCLKEIAAWDPEITHNGEDEWGDMIALPSAYAIRDLAAETLRKGSWT